MIKIGIVHGRFQPFHLDHLKYFLVAKKKCDLLIVGITNPDPILTKYDEANPHRSLFASNPFTYFERFFMIKEALLNAGLKRNEFEIVPFPINKPELLKHYVPIEKSIFYMTVFDEWGWKKKKTLESIGAKVEILWSGKKEDKGLSSSEIRKRIIKGEKWNNLVPVGVYRIMKDWKLDQRLQEMKK